MTIGSLSLIPILFWRGAQISTVGNLSFENWFWVLLTAVFLFGYVLTWYSALKRAPATYVATLLVPATLVTNLLSVIFVTHAVNGFQIASAVLFSLGAWLVINFAKKAGEQFYVIRNT